MANDIVLIKQKDTHISDSVQRALSENFEIGLSSLSDKNRLQYESTYRQWQTHAEKNDCAALNFDLVTVRDFLMNEKWSFNTRKVKLAHLRKFAQLLALSDVENQTNFAHNYNRLSLLKPKSLGGKKSILTTTALTNRQVFRLFDAIASDSNVDYRNRSILAVMLFCGLRSSEAVSLKWSDIEYEQNRLLVRDGKGGKTEYVPLLGDVKQALSDWQAVQKQAGSYDYVCVPIFRSDRIGDNLKCSTRMVGTLIKKLRAATGIEFRPHDTRRTAITELLQNGASIADVRDFARHKTGQTTLIYATGSDATKLSLKLENKLKYGNALTPQNVTPFATHFECECGNLFEAIDAVFCPECGSQNLTEQIDMFAI